jgi:hypothetical protein
MQDTQQSFRDELLARQQNFRAEVLDRQQAANLPVGEVVFAVLPDGQKKIVWGDDILEAIIRTNKPAKLLMIDIPVKTMAEVRTLADRYCTACDDPTGTC